MKHKIFISILLILIFTVLEATAVNYIRIFNSKPDLLLILIAFVSLNWGAVLGLAIGALCGLFAEATSGMPAGFLILSYSLGGLALGGIGKLIYHSTLYKSEFYRQKILTDISITFIFTLAIYLWLFFLLRIAGKDLYFLNTFIFVMLPACFYTAACAPVLFRFMKIILPNN